MFNRICPIQLQKTERDTKSYYPEGTQKPRGFYYYSKDREIQKMQHLFYIFYILLVLDEIISNSWGEVSWDFYTVHF